MHLLGLVSYGGVHSHMSHIQALLRFAPEKTWIHAFTDGRDVSPHSAVHDLAELPIDRIATVCGRYYSMDRDGRWERTERALDAVVKGVGTQPSDPTNSEFFQAGIPGCELCAVFHGDYIGLAYGSDGHANGVWTDMRDPSPFTPGLFLQFIYYARK